MSIICLEFRVRNQFNREILYVTIICNLIYDEISLFWEFHTIVNLLIKSSFLLNVILTNVPLKN